MRGSGDSTGFYYDEYDYQEQKDACELIGNVVGVERVENLSRRVEFKINCGNFQ